MSRNDRLLSWRERGATHPSNERTSPADRATKLAKIAAQMGRSRATALWTGVSVALPSIQSIAVGWIAAYLCLVFITIALAQDRAVHPEAGGLFESRALSIEVRASMVAERMKRKAEITAAFSDKQLAFIANQESRARSVCRTPQTIAYREAGAGT